MRRYTGTTVAVAGMLVLPLFACSDEPTRIPLAPSSVAHAEVNSTEELPAIVRQLASARGIGPLLPPSPVRPALVALGQALTFDRILSGNRDISCATCHLPSFGTGDSRSLSVGQGASGLGRDRLHPSGVFIPRNAPPLFNLGAMKHLFWDGRVERDAEGGVVTPAGRQVTPAMKRVFEFGSISALGMFPVTNRAEMRADAGNELSDIPDADLRKIWRALMKRLGAIPEYREMFEAAYPGQRFEEMNFAHASNAIAGFLVDRMSFTNTPWDRFLAGQNDAMTPAQLEGARTFLTLRCSICHSGATFSDDAFHNVAVAQIGPGQGNGDSRRDDFGRMNVTGKSEDRYRFRTTPLRNVELTAPYGHDGAILGLRDFVEHYSESDRKLLEFDPSPLEAALRGTLLPNAAAILAQRDTLLNGVVLTSDLVDQLMAYMSALTDPAAHDLRRVTPDRVPSRLPVDRPKP